MTYKLKYRESEELCAILRNRPIVDYFLTRLRSHHIPTAEHSERVCTLSIDLGIENGIKDTRLRLLGLAGLLHDIGKVAVPLEILSKNGPLTDDEWDYIRQHPRMGFNMVSVYKDTVHHDVYVAGRLFVGHHEFKRSNLYPRNNEAQQDGERIIYDRSGLLLTQLVAVSDIFDALAYERDYKPPLPFETVENILRQDFTGNNNFVNQILIRHDGFS